MNSNSAEQGDLFNVVGYDQTVYGPAAVDTVKEWIAQGTIHDKTPAQRAGSPDWQTLADFAEFSGCWGSAPADPSAQAASPMPATGPVDPARLTEETLARGARVNIDHCFRWAWMLIKSDLLAIAGMSLVVYLLFAAANAAVVGGLLLGVIQGGYFYVLLQRARGRSAGLKEVFAGFSMAFLPLLLAGVVTSLLVGLASLFFVLPGIYLAIVWVFTIPLVIDKGIGFWAAMGVSRRVVGRQFWSVLGLVVTGVVLSSFGFPCLGVGALITIPLFVAALAYAYEDLFTVGSPASQLQPARPDAKVSRWLITSLLVPGLASVLVAAAMAAFILKGMHQAQGELTAKAAPSMDAPAADASAKEDAIPARAVAARPPAPVLPAPIGVEMLTFTPKAAGRKGGFTYRLENRTDKPLARFEFGAEYRDEDGVLEQTVPFSFQMEFAPHAKREEKSEGNIFMSEATRRVILVPRSVDFADGSQWNARKAAVAASAPGALNFDGYDAPATVEVIRFRPKGAGKESG